MKIAIVHDFARGEWPGGADLTLCRLIDTAPIEVVWLTFRDELSSYDRFIICNCRTISPLGLEQLLEGKRYVKIHFDYRFISPKVVRDASLLVYMSPKQRDDMLGKFVGYNSHVMPSLVDPDAFYPGNEKGQGYLWVGNYSRQKGIRNLWEWAEQNQIHIDLYGHGTPRVYLEQSEFCHIKEPISYLEMPSLYKKYRTLVSLLKGPEAGSRVFIEAVLSNLEVITRDEFEGNCSFTEPFSASTWRARLRQAPSEFWRAAIAALSC